MNPGISSAPVPQPPSPTTAPPPPPQPTGTSVCDDLTEIGDDLNTLQYGPAEDEPQELQAIGTLLSKVVAETSAQSSDLSSLTQDYDTTVTNSGDGTDEDPSAILDGMSSMYGDFNALESDC